MCGDIKVLCAAAVEKWGVDAQMDMLTEECGELIVATNHYRRGRISVDKFLEEVADVEILLEQMRHIFGDKHVEAAIDRKLQKYLKHLQKEGE